MKDDDNEKLWQNLQNPIHLDAKYSLNQCLNDESANIDDESLGISFARNPKHYYALLVKRGCGKDLSQCKTVDYTKALRKSMKMNIITKQLQNEFPEIFDGATKINLMKKITDDPQYASKFDLWELLQINPDKDNNHRTIFGYQQGQFQNLQVTTLISSSDEWHHLKGIFDMFLKGQLWGMQHTERDSVITRRFVIIKNYMLFM